MYFLLGGIDDLIDENVTLNDLSDFNDFLVNFKDFLHVEMQVFKKSIKDLIILFKIAEKEKLKKIVNEYNLLCEEEG